MAGGLDDVGRGAAGRGAIVGINVTPLVDVVLVLLVVLMVASTYVVSQTLKVQLPKAGQSDGTATAPLTLTILREGQILLDGAAIEPDALASSLRRAALANVERDLVVSADAAVPHGEVVGVIDAAKAAGFVRFAINVELGGSAR
ncbi:MAG: biopolymer transporter ExbD [Deltaproteobacteria bacterium]|nr:biopolymer transporter ExbD [Deltaproteobacteria bacterium]